VWEVLIQGGQIGGRIPRILGEGKLSLRPSNVSLGNYGVSASFLRAVIGNK